MAAPVYLPVGLSIVQIAQQLQLSPASVRTYLRHPEQMRVGTYQAMLELGVKMPLLTEYVTCDHCHGTGLLELDRTPSEYDLEIPDGE